MANQKDLDIQAWYEAMSGGNKKAANDIYNKIESTDYSSSSSSGGSRINAKTGAKTGSEPTINTSKPAETTINTNAAAPTLNTSKTLSYNTGVRSDDVKSLQGALNSLGYNLEEDGIFGANTKKAVEDYQRKNGLQVDGIVGNQTYTALNNALSTQGTMPSTAAQTIAANAASKEPTPAPATAAVPTLNSSKTLQYNTGVRSNEVKELQQAMNSLGYDLEEDGIFGAKTKAAVEDYQRKNGLQVDGIVGSQTYGSLNNALANKSNTAPTETVVSEPEPETVSQPAQETSQQDSDIQAWYRAMSSGDKQTANNIYNKIQGTNYGSNTGGQTIEPNQTFWRMTVNPDGTIDWEELSYGDSQTFQNGDAIVQNGEYMYYDEATGKFVDADTFANKYMDQEQTIWRMVVNEDGTMGWQQMNGSMSRDRRGNPVYSVNGQGLQHGDAVIMDGDYMYYDATTDSFVDGDTWQRLFMSESPTGNSQNANQGNNQNAPKNNNQGNNQNGNQPANVNINQNVSQNPSMGNVSKDANTKAPSEMAPDELLDYLYDTLYDNFADSTEVEEFLKSLTWPEAQAIAREYYNPIYNESLDRSMENIDKRSLNSGFYGQLPAEAMKREAIASAEVEKASAITELALSLMNDDRDVALTKFNAMLKAKQIDLDTILTLIGLAQAQKDADDAEKAASQNGGTMSNNIVFNAPPAANNAGGNQANNAADRLNPTASNNDGNGGKTGTGGSNGGNAGKTGNNGSNGGNADDKTAEPAKKNGYDDLFNDALASGYPQSFIANHYKEYGFTSSSGLWNDYKTWAENSGGSNGADNADNASNSGNGGGTGGNTGGAGTKTGRTGGTGGSSGPTWDNGRLSAEEVKALQRILGVEADGYYGANSRKAAGGLSADAAYQQYVPAQLQMAISNAAGNGNTGNAGNGGNAGSGGNAGNAGNTGDTGSTGSNSGPTWDNGALTKAQVQELQRALGVNPDGYYGSQSKTKAGGLSADAAYRKYVSGGGTILPGLTPAMQTDRYGSPTGYDNRFQASNDAAVAKQITNAIDSGDINGAMTLIQNNWNSMTDINKTSLMAYLQQKGLTVPNYALR